MLFFIFVGSFLGVFSAVDQDETLFEGDMLLGKERVGAGLASSALADPYRKWTGGTLFYRFYSRFTNSEVNRLKAAMNEIERNTCVQFKLADPSINKDYVNISKPSQSVCQAFVGKKGGSQDMFLHSDCFTRVTLIHELMHALGFVHEHTRSDRDQFITVLDENIQEESKVNFRIYDRSALLTKIMETGYAYDSVMQYKETDFSANGKPTMKAKNGRKLGPPENEISRIDVYRINLLYECLSDSETSPAVLKLTTPLPDAGCSKPVVVKPDDTCWSISVANNIPLSDFIKINSKVDCNRIYPGLRLCLVRGAEGTLPSAVNCAKWHTASPGEYCDLIMTNYDLVPEEFYQLNPNINCDNLNVGNRICIEAGSGITTTPSGRATGPPKSADCFNINQCCSFWAEDGRCNTQKAFMNEYCKLACGLCSPSNFDSSNGCTNRHVSCKNWFDKGECGRNPFYMFENCREECGECWRDRAALCEAPVPKSLSEEQAWLATTHGFVWAWGCRFTTENGQIIRKTQLKECVSRCAAASCDHFSWNPSHSGTCTLNTGIANYKSPDCATADFVCGFRANKVRGFDRVKCV